MVQEYFSVVTDAAFWFQLFCAAVFTVTATDYDEAKKWNWGEYAGKLAVCMAVFFCVNLLFFLLSKWMRLFAGIGFWFAYLSGILVFVLFFCKYDGNARIVLASAVFSVTIVVCELGSTLGMILEYYIDGFDSLYTKVAADFLLLLAAWVFRRYSVAKYEVSRYVGRLNLVCAAASSLVVIVYDLFLIHVLRRDNIEFTHYIILMFIVLLFLYMIDFVAYMMTYALSGEHTKVLELMMESQVSKSAAQMLDISEYNLNELHKIRHDIDNQYSYMNVLLKNKDYGALEHYFEEMVGTFAKPLVPVWDCGNRVLNVIMYMEQIKAEEAGVALDLKIVVPKTLPFKEVDLCKLLTNLIDNAIEACVAEKIQNPVVSVCLGLRGDYFYGHISNPTKKKRSFFEHPIVTEKSDVLSHGKGMQIVRQVTEKYHGQYQNKIEDRMFQVTFMLDMCAESE